MWFSACILISRVRGGEMWEISAAANKSAWTCVAERKSGWLCGARWRLSDCGLDEGGRPGCRADTAARKQDCGRAKKNRQNREF